MVLPSNILFYFIHDTIAVKYTKDASYNISPYVGARHARLCVCPALTNALFINESTAVQFFWDALYRISHVFDITHDLLMMAWHFNYIFLDLYR